MGTLRKWGRSLLLSCLAFAAPAALAPAVASADPHEARLPLREGKVHVDDLSRALCRCLRLPEKGLPGDGTIDVSGLEGAKLVDALNQSVGDALRVTVDGDALVLFADPDKLPTDCDAAKLATRLFTAVAAPEATAAQKAFYGMKLHDEPLDRSRPLVVLIHGLDCDRYNWGSIAKLLTAEGYQVAYFTYPSDQPVADSAAMLGEEMTKLRTAMAGGPHAHLDIIAHSMGGLVARAYVEGEGYRGGVDHLILLGTPNQGSDWANCRWFLEADEHYGLWKHEPNWKWTWMITDGLGEAGSDLKPGSEYLKHLNGLERREGVKYTVVAGNRSATRRVTADCIDWSANLIRGRAAKWWGFRHTRNGLSRWAAGVRDKESGSDGPVPVESTKLEGVEDFVVLPADHATLYLPPSENEPPVAWAVIKDRLSK